MPAGLTCLHLLSAAAISLGMSYIFYQSLIPGVILFPFCGYGYMKRRKKQWFEKRVKKLRQDFKELCSMLSSFLLAGYSIENAMEKAYLQFREAKGNKNDMVFLLFCMLCQLRIGESAETVWDCFAKENPVNEIQDFGQIFGLSKRSGASISEVLREVNGQLDLKIRTELQIETQIAGKQTEQKIMNLMPAAILVYICLTSADMMQIMYITVVGRLVMTVCLVIYIGAFCLAEYITSFF